MSEMVDRVARALIDADPHIHGYHETHMEIKRPAARAAIEAMRQFTQEMAIAAIDERHEGMADMWNAVIDEALK